MVGRNIVPSACLGAYLALSFVSTSSINWRSSVEALPPQPEPDVAVGMTTGAAVAATSPTAAAPATPGAATVAVRDDAGAGAGGTAAVTSIAMSGPSVSWVGANAVASLVWQLACSRTDSDAALPHCTTASCRRHFPRNDCAHADLLSSGMAATSLRANSLLKRSHSISSYM